MRQISVPSEEDLAVFISRQRQLLAQERAAEVERTSLLLSNCSQKLLEQKGLALGSLGVANVSIGLGGKSLIELDRPTAYNASPVFPPHSMRPGDLARIEENMSSNATGKKPSKVKKAGSDPKGKTDGSVEGVVYKVSDTRITIVVDPSAPGADELDLPDRCRVVKLANSITYDRMEQAIDQLERMVISVDSTTANKATPQRTKLVEVLLCLSAPSKRVPWPDLKFFDESLNPSQREAVRFALEAPEVACIHGPPGTGKTYTLIEIIRQLTTISPSNPRPQRVLVCGASNLSVDNILERLLALPGAQTDKSITTTRIGHPARVISNDYVLRATLEAQAARSDQAELAKDVKGELENTLGVLSGKGKGSKGKAPRGAERRKMWDEVKALRKEYRQREGTVVKTVLGNSQVVVATCHSSGGRQLYGQRFDVVIIDEATQAMEPVCWVPIFKAKKLILAGDPKQLPPTILSVDKNIKNDKNTKKVDSTSEASQKPGEVQEDDENGSNTSGDEDSEPESVEEEGENHEVSPQRKSTAPKQRLAQLVPPRSLETTLFDRLEKAYGPGIKKMLNVQYRMHAHIAAFPSKTMYSSRLKSHESVAKHLLRDLPNSDAATEEEEQDILATPIVFFDTAGCEYFERLDGDADEGSRCNENEATLVKNWVESLIHAGILPPQIAVITPYQAQVTLLSSLLRPLYGTELEIGTVDGMQGREKDAIVISLVRSNGKREVGFLKEKRRLNVAMTRAKRSLCVIGDSETVKHGSSFLRKWMAWLDTNADVRYAGPE